MAKMFKKKEIFKVKSVPLDPTTMGEPSSVDDYHKRGMAFYARKQYTAAEADLKQAISMDNESIDSYYILGMVLKALNRKDEAIEAFNKVINLLREHPPSDATKFDMLRRLALGHINEISHGDWDLEKEIWKHVA